jgi:SOS response regulatory protein OraA/RecX
VPHDARRLAVEALARRDLSAGALGRKLRAAGVEERDERETLDWLASAGLLDDRRLAAARAQALCERGYGDLVIDARLEQEGIGREDRDAAIAELEPERERARRAARAAGAEGRRRVAGLLARRGYCDDSIESAVALLDGRAGAELR